VADALPAGLWWRRESDKARTDPIGWGRAPFAPPFVALQSVLLRRTPRYACAAQASARLVIHRNSPRPKDAWVLLIVRF
jgi:hypothetical protein